jgi:hypothetical protein
MPGGAAASSGSPGDRAMLEHDGHGREAIAPEPRGRVFSELAQYFAPKRKAVERSTEEDAPRFVLIGVPETESAKAWERRVVDCERKKGDPQ